MNKMDNHEPLQLAIEAIRSGDKVAGKRLLARVLFADPQNVRAWLWMSEAADTDEQRRECLSRVLTIEPGNQTVRAALARQTEPAARPTQERSRDADPWPSPTAQVTSPGGERGPEAGLQKRPMPGISPYKGLVPYDPEDAPWFFGRDGEREIIIANLMASRLTLLYGTSGVGKSSVLRAGVAHHLGQRAQRNLSRRGTPGFALVTFQEWRDDPLAGLLDEVQRSVRQARGGKAPDKVPPARPFVDALRAWAGWAGGELYVVLDQFEEYFLYHLQEDGEGTFAVEFPQAVNRPDLRVSFLISIREDALAKLDRFKGRIPGLFDNYIRVEHLDGQAARDAITKPIQQYNRSQAAAGERIEIEPALVEAVLEQVQTGRVTLGNVGKGMVRREADTPAARLQVETPYLQLVMTRLWNEEIGAGSRVLRLETLQRLGNAEQIVRSHLEDTVAVLSRPEQDAAARAFYHLVTPSGAKIAHTAPDLASLAELEQGQLEPVLAVLSERRILRPVSPPPDQPDTPRYEIFHDVLASAVLDWRARYARAQERAEAERKAAEQAAERKRELEQARALAEAERRRAEEEEKRADAEARGKRRAQRLTAAVIVVALLAAAAVGFAGLQMTRAQESENIHATIEAAHLVKAAAVAAKATQQQDYVLTLEVSVAQLLALQVPSTATPTPTGRSTPPTTGTPTHTPIATQTPTPTFAVAPVKTQLAAAQATRVAEATKIAEAWKSCPFTPQGEFSAVWDQYGPRLGCPLHADPIRGPFAEQPFQNGWMFWAEFNDTIIVILRDSVPEKPAWYLVRPENVSWPIVGELDCLAEVPAGLVQPISGFGGVWCHLEGIRERIGLATQEEYGVPNGKGDLWQEFENGLIFRNKEGDDYLLFMDDGSYLIR